MVKQKTRFEAETTKPVKFLIADRIKYQNHKNKTVLEQDKRKQIEWRQRKPQKQCH